MEDHPDMDQVHKDCEFARQGSYETSSQSQSQATGDTKYEALVKESKFIVHESSLDQLFVHCRAKIKTDEGTDVCGSLIISKEKHVEGAAVTVKTECLRGCTDSWSSSPRLGEKGKGFFVLNILLSAVILTVGSSFTSVKRVFNDLRLNFITHRQFNRHCQSFLYPVVWFFWIKQQDALLTSLKGLEEDIEMAGDGRFDSPGFTAAICVYYVLCLNIKKVVALSVVHKSQTQNKSKSMEQLGLQTTLHHITASGVRPKRFATDRCVDIKCLMEDRYPMIDQEYDVWHWIKNVMKDLIKASKTKPGQALRPWIKSINNMLWYAFTNCKGDHILLQEMVMSIVGHTCNRHDFQKFTVFKKCLHGKLHQHQTPWLIPGEYPALKLIEVLKGKDGSRFLALEKMAHGMNTFLIESLNNKALVWAPKRLHYPPQSVLIRSSLTAMDFNENVDRDVATTKEGTPRFNIVANRAGTKFTMKPIKNENTHSTMDLIRAFVLNCRDLNVLPQVKYPLPTYPKNTAKVEKPSKSDAAAAQKTRFKH